MVRKLKSIGRGSIGMKKWKRFVERGLVERLGDNSFETVLNQRLAHCKVCGDEIPKEEGVSWIFYATYTSHSDKLPPSFMDQFPTFAEVVTRRLWRNMRNLKSVYETQV